ncbi:MAG: histidine kinase [Prolixibacteraceae bacterium]|nr:histidine kinase [Prolixibacteraceae bacterium]MBN2774363.1 histidine kinase [Prolixibacteraceae bacterium]
MPKIKSYYKLRIIGHLVFWLASIIYWFILFYMVDKENFSLTGHTLLKDLILNLSFAISVYINLYILIPKLFIRKNYIYYGFWLILLLASSSVLIQILFIYPFHYIFSPEQFDSFDPSIYSRYFFVTFLYVAITSVLKFIKEWFILQDLKFKYEQIERQKLEAELKTLKGQVHPHFLFNSLNNVYSLSLTNPEKVPDLILKLSDLLRHAIYESRENFIKLSKEIGFVENYLSLQKIRVSDKVKIEYIIKGTVPEKLIAPLLFEPFIDNAFKHGLSGNSGNEFVKVNFDFTKPDYLEFTIENSYEKLIENNTKYKGIGLENVKQRLSHLYNKDKYELKITDENNIYKVFLGLHLKE